MIIIALVFLVVLLIALYILSFATSTRIGRILSAARLSIGTWWNNLNPPTRQEVWEAIRPGIVVIAILAGCMLLVWLLLFITIVTICSAMGSFLTGLWIGFLILMVAVTYIFKKIPGFRTTSTIGFYLLLAVLIYSSGNFIFEWWSPEAHSSFARLNENFKKEFSDSMDSKSIETEGKLGKIGRVDYAGVHGYKEVDGTLFTANLQKGKYVRLVTEIPGQKLSKASGGMVWVMLQNDQGDFVRGSLWMVHPHKVNWDWQQQDAAAKALAEVERVAKAQAEAAKVEATKEAAKEAAQKAAAKKAAEENLSGEWTLRYSDKFSEKTVTVEVNENNLMITSGQVVFQGRKTENCKYEGKWFNGKTMNQGRFALAFINREQANGRFASKDGEIFPIFMKKK